MGQKNKENEKYKMKKEIKSLWEAGGQMQKEIEKDEEARHKEGRKKRNERLHEGEYEEEGREKKRKEIEHVEDKEGGEGWEKEIEH